MRRVGFVIAAACVLTAVVSAQQIRITKEARDADPALFLAEFKGDAAVRATLARAIECCGWFSVARSPAEADFVLRAAHSSAGGGRLRFDLSHPDGKVAARLEQRGPAKTPRTPGMLVYRGVDALIKGVFGNPGPCASRLVFALGHGRRKELATCNFDGSDPTQLTYNRTISTEPAWGPGGATLVYTLYGPTYTDVVLMDLVNQRQRRISHFPGLNSGGALSPDGRWVALSLSRDGQVDLYLMRLADQALRRLTRDRSVESSPCWSPDGKRLCYVSDRSRRPRLYLISVTGGSGKALLAGAAECVSPDWSAVSDRLCFSTRRGGQYAVAVLDMGKPQEGVQIVTRASGDWESPSWAPDGRHLVCVHSDGGARELCTVDTWRKRIRPITRPGRYSLPNWSPAF